MDLAGRHAVGCRRSHVGVRGPGRGARHHRRQPLGAPRRALEALSRPRSETHAMDLEFTEEQDMLRELVRGVGTAYAPSDVVRDLEDDPTGYPAELWKQLAELDLIGLLLPPEYGGSGMSALEGAVLYEELGRCLAP